MKTLLYIHIKCDNIQSRRTEAVRKTQEFLMADKEQIEWQSLPYRCYAR